MYAYLLKFIRFILPILKTATIQVAADTITDMAYPDRRRVRAPYTSYDRMAPRTRRQAQRNIGRSFREHEEIKRREMLRDMPADRLVGENPFTVPGPTQEDASQGFHDVLMVAFDLSGPNAATVHAWLHQQMPKPEEMDDDTGVYLDSWWVANDERFDRSDCDSAVFVSKGNQVAARAELKSLGLVN